MEIKKLENRYQWICNIDGFSYVRTEIEWKDKPNSIVWHLNQDESGDEEVTGPNDDKLEELFWKANVKTNEPIQILGDDVSEYEKNDMDDFVVNGKLSISKLYELAKKEGFEDRTLFFSVKNKTTGQHFSTDTVVDFGKGWSKDTAIMHLIWEELPHTDACQG